MVSENPSKYSIGATVAVLCLLGAGAAGAWDADFGLHVATWDNFFQARDTLPKEEVRATILRARGSLPLGAPDRGLKLYGLIDVVRYDAFDDDSPGGGVGLRMDGESHRFDLYAAILRDRPRFETGEEVERADVAQFRASYSNRFTSDWQATGTLLHADETFELNPQSDAENLGFRAALRYRGFGRGFSPEVGFGWGERTVAATSTSDYDQREWWLRVRSTPTDWLYLSARFRQRHRPYQTGDVGGDNFGREDDRDQIDITANISAPDNRFVVTFLYTWQDAVSTKESRNFETNRLQVGVRFRVGPDVGP